MRTFSRRLFLVSSSSALLLSSQAAIGTSYTSHYGIIKNPRIDLDISSDVPQAARIRALKIYALVDPDFSSKHVEVSWQFSIDEEFNNIIQEDIASFVTEEQTLLSITLMQVPPGTILYYRFSYKYCDLIQRSDFMDEQLPIEGVATKNFTVYPTKAISKNLLSVMRKEIKAYDMTTSSQSS